MWEPWSISAINVTGTVLGGPLTVQVQKKCSTVRGVMGEDNAVGAVGPNAAKTEIIGLMVESPLPSSAITDETFEGMYATGLVETPRTVAVG